MNSLVEICSSTHTFRREPNMFGRAFVYKYTFRLDNAIALTNLGLGCTTACRWELMQILYR